MVYTLLCLNVKWLGRKTQAKVNLGFHSSTDSVKALVRMLRDKNFLRFVSISYQKKDEIESTQKRLVQPTIHRNDLPSRLAQSLSDQQKERFRLVSRCDGCFREGSVCVEFCQLTHE